MSDTTPTPKRGSATDDPCGLEIPIPGREALRLLHLVIDFNGTLATDGHLVPGAIERIHELANTLRCHLLTADTHGGAADAATQLACRLQIVPREAQAAAKTHYITELNAARCVAIGNGSNDAPMLTSAALGICVIGAEGAATEALLASDIVCTSVLDALDLLTHPLRLAATLRR